MSERLKSFWKSNPEDPFDAFFEHGDVLMHSIDETGVLTKVSSAWAAVLGYAPEEMLGRKSTEFLSDASRAHALETVLPEFRKTGTVTNVAYEFIARDGQIVDVLMSAVSVYDEEGVFLRSLAILFDNRAARAAQRALEKKAAEAEEASRAKSRFLAAMSHEIRTPMNAILGFAQLLKLSHLDDKRASHVDAILRAGGSLMNLLTDLLDLAQVEDGKMRIETAPVDLREMIDQVAGWWYSGAQDKGLRLNVTIDQALPQRIATDAGRIEQVLNNFLGNAVKFTETGEIALRVLRVGGEGQSARLRFEVRDTGPGLEPAKIDHLFLPFVQIESDFGKDRGGWGLGLSICRNIAEAMGGEVGAISEPGRGATFFFETDVSVLDQPADPRETCPPDSETRDPDGPLRVLLAEDNPMSQEMMRETLRGLGHQVVVAANGFEAVQATLRDRFDLVLMDIAMPGLDGIGATRQIRMEGSGSAKVPIVACTAHVSSEAQARYREVGMNDFLPKPVDPGALEQVISRVLAS